MTNHPILLEAIARNQDAERWADAANARLAGSSRVRMSARDRTGWALIHAGTRLLLPGSRATNRITAAGR
jgi:hypothetical protein